LHKPDVPNARIALNLVPALNPRNWHIEDHRAPRELRIQIP
jgi:hypothetical protein